MKQFKGIVSSDKMENTVSVIVERNWMHPLYKKTVKKTKKYLVHDEKGAKAGDVVIFEETKPISKRKKFKVVSIEK
ncbi:30S ribosomal protein S17 [Patescibacteria group bacterium]